MLPLSHYDRSIRFAAVLVLALDVAACDRSTAQQGGAASAEPAASAAPAGTAEPAPVADEAPRGAGVVEFKPAAGEAACKMKPGEMATYLLRPGLGLAGRADGAFAAVWLVELQKNPEAQIAFAGFDGEARQVARARSIGSTREEGVRVFSNGGSWTVTWTDGEGLAYARPRWETSPPPERQHLGAIGKEAAENVAIAAEPGGALVAAAPFGAARDQLGVFLFAPSDASQPSAKALGVTHHARQPRRPAVAGDAAGHLVAWHEEDDGSIVASRFDLAGKQRAAHVVLAAGAKREHLGLVVAGDGGLLAVWSEGGVLIARALGPDGAPRAAPWVIGKGAWRSLAPTGGEGAFVAWVGNDGQADGQLLLARLGADGAPSAQGLRLSDGVTAVKDPPALAVAGARVGVAWTEVMGPAVSTKRALLRVIDAACIP